MLRGAQGLQDNSAAPMSLRGGLRAAPRDMAGRAGLPRLGLDRVPYIPLWRLDTAIPRGANQQITPAGRGAPGRRRHRLSDHQR